MTPCCASRNAIEKMPVACPVATGVAAMAHVRPPSDDRSTRDAVVPIHTCSRPNIATLVPLAAKAPSPGRAGGTRSAATRSQVRPPSTVLRITNRPSTESLKAIPRSASQNAIASRNTLGSVFANCRSQCAPPSFVL